MQYEDLSAYSIVQLRAWLRSLELPSSGNKSTLIVRLTDLPADQRGKCPTEDNTHNDTCSSQVDADDSEQEQQEEQRSDQRLELEMLKREADLLRREKDLLERENLLLRNNEKATGTSAVQPKISLDLLKNLLQEYEGGPNFSVWVAQFKSIVSTYNVSENEQRVLLLGKLKGKAQNWLQSKINFVTESVDALLSDMGEIFDLKENRITLRRQLEARKWKPGEKFVHYLNDKLMLANPLQLEEEEIVEYAIEGIGDYRLRTQAYLQCYTTKAQLIKAFANVEIKATTSTTAKAETSVRDLRCYNRNIRGHLSSECWKPKRELGACYVCGSKTHRAAVCDKKKGVHLVDEYNV